MAQVKTSITAAVTSKERFIPLATTAGMLVDDRIIVGREVMRVNVVESATVARVQRGMDGTGARAHAADEGAIFGQDSDFVLEPGDKSIQEGGGISYTALGAILHTPGAHRVNGTTLAMTLAVPSADDEGLELVVVAENASAHTLTVAGGVGGAGAGADVGTFGGAIGDGVVMRVVNGLWFAVSNTNVTFA